MAVKLLTARFIDTVKPGPVRTEYADAACKGLYLIVQPGGSKSYAARFERPSDGKTAKKTLGSADDLSLAAARAAVAADKVRLERGQDPAPPRASVAPAVAYTGSGDSVAEAVGAFLTLHCARKNRRSTAWAAERIFNRLVLPRWGKRSIHDIKRRDVIDLVEHIATDRPYLANRTLGVLSKFFKWLVARDRLAASPVTGVERPHKEVARDRTLSDNELRALWLACEPDDPFGAALRLLVLTGTRRNEVSQMAWDEIDEQRRLWVLPSARSKNGREHTVPLASRAWDLIQARPRFADCRYVFTADGSGPIIGWAKAKTRISGAAGASEKSWRLHDLRRTAAAGMQRIGIAVPVIEKALNHVSGTFRGIVGVYQTHDYADEVAVALQKWADRVEEIVGGEPAKVVTLRRRKEV
jgi:integrase